MAELEPEDGRGLVAVAGDPEHIVAHAAYMRETPGRAEVAFVVADEWQGRGIATVLLAHLSELASAEGIATFTAVVLPDNRRMIQVFRDSGFAVEVRSLPGRARDRVPGRARRGGPRAVRGARPHRRGGGRGTRAASRVGCGHRRVEPRGIGRRGGSAQSVAPPGTRAGSPSCIRARTWSAACRRIARSPTCPSRSSWRSIAVPAAAVVRGRAGVRRGRRARARGAVGRLRRGRSARPRPPGRAARRLPRERDAAGRPELPRRAQHGRGHRPERDVRAGRAAARAALRSHPRAARSASRRSPRRRAAGSACPRSCRPGTRPTCPATTCCGSGRATRDRRDRAVPGVVRQPAPVRADRPPRRRTQAGDRGQERALGGRRASRDVAHRRAARRVRRDGRRAVPARRRDPHRHGRRAVRRRRAARRPAAARAETASAS